MDPSRTHRPLWAFFTVIFLTVFLGAWVFAAWPRPDFFQIVTDVLALALLAVGFGWLLQTAIALFFWWMALGPRIAEAADYRDEPAPDLPHARASDTAPGTPSGE